MEVGNVLVDFRLSWGTNKIDCTSAPDTWWRLPYGTLILYNGVDKASAPLREVAATNYLVKRYKESHWFPKIT